MLGVPTRASAQDGQPPCQVALINHTGFTLFSGLTSIDPSTLFRLWEHVAIHCLDEAARVGALLSKVWAEGLSLYFLGGSSSIVGALRVAHRLRGGGSRRA